MFRSLLSARLFPRALVARVRAPPRGSALVASGLLVFAANDVAHAAGSEVPAAKKRKEKVGTTERKKVRGGAILIPLVSDPSIGYGEEEDPVHAWATALGPPNNKGGWTHQCVTDAITAVINVITARDEGGVKGFLKRVYRGPDKGKPKPLTHSDCEDLKSGFREALKPVFGITCESGYWKRHQAFSAMHTKAVEAVNTQAVEDAKHKLTSMVGASSMTVTKFKMVLRRLWEKADDGFLQKQDVYKYFVFGNHTLHALLGGRSHMGSATMGDMMPRQHDGDGSKPHFSYPRPARVHCVQWSSHLKGQQTQSQDGTLAGMLHRDKDLAFLVTVGLQLIYLHGRWRENHGFCKMAWAPTLDKYHDGTHKDGGEGRHRPMWCTLIDTPSNYHRARPASELGEHLVNVAKEIDIDFGMHGVGNCVFARNFVSGLASSANGVTDQQANLASKHAISGDKQSAAYLGGLSSDQMFISGGFKPGQELEMCPAWHLVDEPYNGPEKDKMLRTISRLMDDDWATQQALALKLTDKSTDRDTDEYGHRQIYEYCIRCIGAAVVAVGARGLGDDATIKPDDTPLIDLPDGFGGAVFRAMFLPIKDEVLRIQRDETIPTEEAEILLGPDALLAQKVLCERGYQHVQHEETRSQQAAQAAQTRAALAPIADALQQQQGALQRLLPSDELPSLSPDSEIHDRGLLVDADFARAAGVTHDPSEPLSVVISSLGSAQPPTLRDTPGMQLGSAYGQSRAGAAALADASTSLSLSASPAPALSTPASATPSPHGFAASPSAAEQPIAESAGFPVILRPASVPSLGGPSGTQLQPTPPGQEVFSLDAGFPTLVVNYVGAKERLEECCAVILEAKGMALARGHGSAPAWRSDLVPTPAADASEEEKKDAAKAKKAFNTKVSTFKLLLDAIVLHSGALKPGGVDYPSITRCIRSLSGTRGAKEWGAQVRKSYENGTDGYGEKSAARAAYEGVRGGSEEERLAAAHSFRKAVLDALDKEPSLSSFADAGGAPGAASSSLTPLKRGRDESVLARFLAVDPGAGERSATGVADFTFADGLCSSIRATSFMPRGTHVQKKKRVATEISALLDAVKPVCVFLEECYPPVGGYKYKLMELNHALRFAVVEACEERDVPCYMVNASTWLSHIGVSYPSGAKDEAKKKLVLVGAEPKGGGERGGLLSALGLRHDSIPFDMKRHDAADAVAIGLAGLAGKRDGYKKEKHVVTIKPRLPEGSSEPPRLGSPSQLEFVELSQL